MACKYICDGCGKEVSAIHYGNSTGWHKPGSWFQRMDDDGPQDACGRPCTDKIAEESGKTRVILPI